jgi:large subunit ribosomal protein L15
MDLSNLKPSPGSVKNRKRLGRGPGSGTGKTSGKGHKGQKARSGYKSKAWSEGGQMPLQRRLPKRGFTNIFRVDYQEANVAVLEKLDSNEITPDLLREKGVARGRNKPIKILGSGEITRAITVKAHAFSRSAVEKIQKAGGSVEIIGAPKETEKLGPSSGAGKSDSKKEQSKPDVQTDAGDKEDSGIKDADSGDQE